jgi:hypothetical protein
VQQLDILAVLCTAAKALFVGGALAAAQQLCALVEPARAASGQALHLTHIRNEVAYCACVEQLLTSYPPPLVARPRRPQPPQQERQQLQQHNEEQPPQRQHQQLQMLQHQQQHQLRPLYMLGDSHCLAGALLRPTGSA